MSEKAGSLYVNDRIEVLVTQWQQFDPFAGDP